jgi:hypothetical protein
MADKSNPSDKPVTGSVIFDGTTYSGADIKIVVHVYDKKAPRISKKIDELERFLVVLQSEKTFSGDQQLAAVNNQAKIAAIKDQVEFLKRDLTEFGDIRITTKVLTECQTLSISTYREKYPVRSLGSVYPKSFTRGPRTIAGSMVFTVFNKNVLYELLDADPTDFDAETAFSSALIDQLPPFDITISFANELGQTSRMAILGVEFVSEGQTMSIQDLFLENTTQWVARDIDPMTKVGQAKRDADNLLTGQELIAKPATSLIQEAKSQEYIGSKDPFSQRFKRRSDPFK